MIFDCKKLLTHLKGVGINISYQETQVLVNTALVDQFKVFVALFQGRNNRIHNCHLFTKYSNTIIDLCKDDAVFPKEDAFINPTLNEVTSD